MKTRVILTTVVAFLLLLAAVAAGLNAIFTVTLVSAEFDVFSDAGREEAVSLKAELDGFVGSSTTFLKLDDVKETVEKYPCFRLESAEKKFPETLEVRISERREFFAVRDGENGYAVLDEAGGYLYHKDENVNRTGGENILLEKFDISYGREEALSGEYVPELLEMFGVFSEMLPGVRANVVSVSLERQGSDRPENYRFLVSMREGVKLVIVNPSEGISVKARLALTDEGAGYLSPAFPAEQRLYGSIIVGNLTADGTSANVSFYPEVTVV